MAGPATLLPRPAAPGWLVWAALVVVYIVWGSPYLAIRVVVADLPAMLSGGLRFLVAGAAMLAVVAMRVDRAVLRSVDLRQLGWAAFSGCALATGGNGLVMVAEQSIASGVAALIVAMVPVWVVLMRRGSGDRVSRVTLGGVVAGFGSSAGFSASRSARPARSTPKCSISTRCWPGPTWWCSGRGSRSRRTCGCCRTRRSRGSPPRRTSTR